MERSSQGGVIFCTDDFRLEIRYEMNLDIPTKHKCLVLRMRDIFRRYNVA